MHFSFSLHFFYFSFPPIPPEGPCLVHSPVPLPRRIMVGWGGVERVQSSSNVGLMRFLSQSGPRGDVSLLAKEGTETSLLLQLQLLPLQLLPHPSCQTSLFIVSSSVFLSLLPSAFFHASFLSPPLSRRHPATSSGKETNWPTGEAPVIRLGSR